MALAREDLTYCSRLLGWRDFLYNVATGIRKPLSFRSIWLDIDGCEVTLGGGLIGVFHALLVPPLTSEHQRKISKSKCADPPVIPTPGDMIDDGGRKSAWLGD
jgi:hypothetical protein